MEAFEHWVDVGTPAEVAIVAAAGGLVFLVEWVLIRRMRHRPRSQSVPVATSDEKPN